LESLLYIKKRFIFTKYIMLYQNRVRLMVPFVKTKGNAASEDSEGKINKDAYGSKEYRSFQKIVKIIDDKENKLRDAIMNAQDISPETKEKLLYLLVGFTEMYGEYNRTYRPSVLYAARQYGKEINSIWWYAKRPERTAIVRFLHEMEPLVPELVREALKGIPERYIQQREELSTLRRSELRKAFLSAFRKVDSGIKEVVLLPELLINLNLDKDRAVKLLLGTAIVVDVALPVLVILANQHIITQELLMYGASGLIATEVVTATYLSNHVKDDFPIGTNERSLENA